MGRGREGAAGPVPWRAVGPVPSSGGTDGPRPGARAEAPGGETPADDSHLRMADTGRGRAGRGPRASQLQPVSPPRAPAAVKSDTHTPN